MTLDPGIITHDELDPPRVAYVPRRIDTPEQAAALPDGSMAYLDDFDAYGAPSRSVAVKHRGSWWADDRELPVAGWTALVPAEVYEGPGGHGPSWYIQADEYDR